MNEKVKPNVISNLIYSIKKLFKIDKLFFLLMSIKTLVDATIVFTYPYILKTAVEGIELKKSFKEVIFEVLVIVLINLILSIISNYINRDTYQYRRQKMSFALIKEFKLNSLKFDYEKFEASDIQDDFEKAGRALNAYGGLIDSVVYSFTCFSNVLSFVIASAIIISINGWLVLCILVLSIIKLFLENYNRKKEKEDFNDKTPNVWRRIGYANNISKNLSIGKDLRIYAMNKFIAEERRKSSNDYLRYYKKNAIRNFIIYSIIDFLKALDEILLYAFMIYEVIYNNMMIATFTFMLSAVRELIGSIDIIITWGGQVINNSYRVSDYRKFLKHNLNVDNQDIKVDFKEVEIEFKNVSYRYLNQEGFALENVSFKIAKGERIALVGFNGAGKTTLIKLLCGFYHPTSGEILINGVNIENIERESLAKLIAPVFQEVQHYAIKVLENVSMKHESDTDYQKAMEALKIATIDEKIKSLPDQENTIITREFDENGIELSGGENQKLSIARAIYKEAALIMLDEPTSALDAIAEYNLYNSLNQIIGTSSAIFVSHRLSSTKFCDRIFLLDEGKLCEVGTHNELLSIDGKYKKLFEMQAEYYKGGEDNE